MKNNKPPRGPEPEEPNYLLSKATITNLGSSAANGTTAAIAAGVGSLIPNTCVLSPAAAGLAGGLVGLVVGWPVNLKAMDVAETRYPSRHLYGLAVLAFNVATSVASGMLAGVAGHCGANPLIAGGVAAGGTAIGLKVLR